MHNKLSELSVATVLSIMAAVCFATQHPMTKPLAERFLSDHSHAIWLSVITLSMSSAAIVFVGVPMLLYSSKNRDDFVSILSESANIAKVFVLSILSSANGMLYIFGVMNNHPVIVSLILNTSPLWGGIWASIISRKEFPNVFFSCLIFAFFGIVTSSLWSYGVESIGSVRNMSYEILLVIPVPIIYTFVKQMTYKWFGNYQGSSAIAACSLGSGVLSLAGLGVMAFLGQLAQSTFMASAIQWSYFLIGTILGAIIGGALYQTAINKAAGNSGYVTLFNLLIPLLSAVIGWGLSVVGQEASVAPTTGHWIGIAIVAATLGAFWKVNRAPR